MDGEAMDLWLESAAFNAENVKRQLITIPIILDSALPPDGWYLKPNRFVEVGAE